MTEHDVANSAKFAEIRGRAEAVVEKCSDSRQITHGSYHAVTTTVGEAEAVARDVLALVGVAEAAQAFQPLAVEVIEDEWGQLRLPVAIALPILPWWRELVTASARLEQALKSLSRGSL